MNSIQLQQLAMNQRVLQQELLIAWALDIRTTWVGILVQSLPLASSDIMEKSYNLSKSALNAFAFNRQNLQQTFADLALLLK